MSEKLSLGDELAERLSQNFITIETVAGMDEDNFRSQAISCGLHHSFADAIKSSITKLISNEES